MSLSLEVEFSENLVAENLVTQKYIPCLCRVTTQFEIVFQSPLPKAVGLVKGWDREQLELRVVPGTGGAYTHYGFGMISIKAVEKNLYKIIDLKYFSSRFEWCPILIGGSYAPPGKFWDDEEEDTIGR